MGNGRGVCIIGCGAAHGRNRSPCPKKGRVKETGPRGYEQEQHLAPGTCTFVDCLLLMISVFLLMFLLIRERGVFSRFESEACCEIGVDYRYPDILVVSLAEAVL